MFTLRHHDIKVAGKARIAHISGRLGLGGPPDPEEAMLLAGGAMMVDAIRSDDGRVQLPRPTFSNPSAPTQDLKKALRASMGQILAVNMSR